MRFLSYLLLICSIFSCVDPLEKELPDIQNNLAEYLDTKNSFPVVTDSLIACATGGVNALATEPDFPISILFRPEGNPTQFLYFETEDSNINPELLDNYWLQSLDHQPIFNGYLRKFRRAGLNSDVWGIVSFVDEKKIYISNPIRIKYEAKPTENNPSLIDVNSEDEVEPKFSWIDGIYDDNAIYFQVVSDLQDNLISGTYTYDKEFQYYRTENVVLDIKPQNPIIVLTEGETYNFTLMAVSEDNWVNLAGQKSFVAE